MFRYLSLYGDRLLGRLVKYPLAGLSRANPDHRFKILFAGYDGEDQHLGALEGEVFKAWLPWVIDKPADRQWEGDDRRWDQILAPWPLVPHGEDRITRTFDESLA